MNASNEKNFGTAFNEMLQGKTYKKTVLITDLCEKTDKNSSPYVTVEMTDKTSAEKGRIFGVSIDELSSMGVTNDSIVDIEVTAASFHGTNSFKIETIRVSDMHGLSKKDFARCADLDCENALKFIDYKLSEFEYEHRNDETAPIATLTKSILYQNREAFLHSAAGETQHHNEVGGLVSHIYSMMQIAETVSKVYKLDEELLICGIVLHDVGKIKALNTDELGNVSPTIIGRINGHEYLGAELLENAYALFESKIDEERVMLLRHLILSHHSKTSVAPAIPEAYALQQIDRLDAGQYVFKETYKTLESGKLTNVVRLPIEKDTIYKAASNQ